MNGHPSETYPVALTNSPPPIQPDGRDHHPMTRGRAYSAATKSSSVRLQQSQSQSRTPQSSDSSERKVAQPYGHHRQTSIVHGVQHSRNGSQMPPNSSSPLSPHHGFVSPQIEQTQPKEAYLRKSPSASAISSTYQILTSPADPQATVRKHTERVHGLRRPRDPESGRSASRQKVRPPELTTVGEYALHHLLTNFIKEADDRIERCMNETSDGINIESICGQGADQGFDQLIVALGHIGRDRPKTLIDSVMLWRRGKSETTQTLRKELDRLKVSGTTIGNNHNNGTVRRYQNLSQFSVNDSTTTFQSDEGSSKITELMYEIRRAERKSAISVYILCRALMEIIAQYRTGTLPEETADRLEEVIWTQVRATDAQSLSLSTVKQAQWNLFGQLLGVMSGPRFSSIRDRYMNELGAMHVRLCVKGHMETELERKAVLLVGNMSWLKVRITPDAAWDQSCDLIRLLSTYFASVHGRAIKHAYCQLIEDLLLPIAAKATAQFNSPKWKAVLDTLRPKISQLLIKPKHWVQAFPLLTVTLCASPAETFNQQWLQIAQHLQPKLRDRSTRSHALKALCRLVWRYLYRIYDLQPQRKLDQIIQMIFQPGKKAILSTEPSIADPLIQLIRIIGYRHQDLCFRNILFPLMNAETILNGKDLRIEALEPERMVIGIRAYLAIMADLEKGEQPRFPQSFECDALLDPYSRSPHSHRRSASQSSVALTSHLDRQSKPVDTANFPDATKNYHVTFCKILGEICIICDNAFGGQAVLDEKLSQTVPKTPMSEAFAFGRRDEVYSPTDVRQGFYDLLHVAVQALPRCILPETPFNPLVNLLCTGTAHMQSHIASSSAQALKSIARESLYSQQVANGFSRFIFNFDDRYATVADGGLLGAQHIESTLRLYVELLEIWIESLQKETGKAPFDQLKRELLLSKTATNDLNRSRQFAHVDEVESHGLFFLCSPSRHVRAFAIRVLRLVSKFDQALGSRTSTRIISILEGSSQQVIDVNDDSLTTAERSRLQKGLRASNVSSTLVDLCGSDISHDSALWVKVFPGIIRLSQLTCPQAVLLTREIVCSRLLHTQSTISRFAEQPESSLGSRSRHTITPSEVTIEQWKLHLIFACTTLTNIGSQTSSATTNGVHTRKSSKNSSSSIEKICSATELFNKVVGFLGASNERVRVAAAVGLGTISPNLYLALLDALQPSVISLSESTQDRSGNHQRSMSSPRRAKRTDFLRTEITHLYRLTAHCIVDEQVIGNERVFVNMMAFTKNLRHFLNHDGIQHQLAFQKLRTHFCGLVEALYEMFSKKGELLKWMPFQTRKALFTMMEDWCGYSPNQIRITEAEELMRRSLLEATPDATHRGGMTAALEIEKKDLRAAALSAMAGLCAGPVNNPSDEDTVAQFDLRRMLQWIDTIFNDTPSDKTHATGRRALKNLIVHNPDHSYLLTRSLEMCFLAKAAKTLSSYFDVVTQVLSENQRPDMPFWRVLCAGLYTLGNENHTIRAKSTHMLRSMEEKTQMNSKLQDLDISVSDKTVAVYKSAQFNISQRLSREHSTLAFHVFSQFSYYFKDLQPDHQRNMVHAMLPWLQTIELQVDQSNRPVANSYMLLVNLIEITVKSSTALHSEIEALWRALATGPHGGNVQVILDFIILVCLDRREQNFVDYAKQVVVFLSKTPAGARVIEFLLMQLTPKSMVHEMTDAVPIPADNSGLPYTAELNNILPAGAKQCAISLGQLSMMLLVDLIVDPVQIPLDKVPVLLQTVITQWDHYTELVRDQAREMLVHLIHELVILRIEHGKTVPDKVAIEELAESIRKVDPRVTWTYEDGGDNPTKGPVSGVPEPMSYVIEEVVRVFSIAFELQAPEFDIRTQWAKTTLEWATACPVRHVACRSFQIYRCILQNPDQEMLADMLTRLQNTIADDENDYLTFSKEILMTLRTIIKRLEPVEILKYPQLFWITAACLDTIYEAEFEEALTMLEQLLDRLDLSDPALIKLFNERRPTNWQGEFNGLQPLVYKGLRSGLCLDRCLRIMDRMVKLPSNELVGGEERLLFTTLANLPRFLHYFADKDKETLLLGDTLANVAETQGHNGITLALTKLGASHFSTESEFLLEIVSAIRGAFFPDHEFDSLVFLLGLLNNQISWYKIKTMKLLCIVLPDVDMRKPEFASQGPDLISPLLRLLQTNYCQQALDVLDNVMSMTGTPLDQKHIRMSMAGSHSSRATRKEYDSTKSLYGIPEESGWSIPMPAIHSARTRHNVQAVVRTCNPDGLDSVETGTPKIEFRDDQAYSTYFPNDSVLSQGDIATEGAMNELVMKLDSLDDFFDDHDDDKTQGRNSMPRFSSIITDERESLYTKHTLPILHKSLDRNASVTSFAASFEDQKYTSPRENIMSPTAFANNSTLNTDDEDMRRPEKGRPGLHARSITSPVAMGMRRGISRNNFAFSEDDADNERQDVLSDDDLHLSRTPTIEATHMAYDGQAAATTHRRAASKGLRPAASNTSLNRGLGIGIHRPGVRRMMSANPELPDQHDSDSSQINSPVQRMAFSPLSPAGPFPTSNSAPPVAQPSQVPPSQPKGVDKSPRLGAGFMGDLRRDVDDT
ncbi:putative cell morphogenesis protein [Myriangium duriaei CBS 260.36]|uniref:Cell morphogenesis protein n=1 Tax=Myriangium duriaei CBS 260.36 TaxID=1168546 RepID=A0A9P4IYX6_9PEZI|nr:putative cell morphogenesis protein [Myriangium duriaei CBS 260.36]